MCQVTVEWNRKKHIFLGFSFVVFPNYAGHSHLCFNLLLIHNLKYFIEQSWRPLSLCKKDSFLAWFSESWRICSHYFPARGKAPHADSAPTSQRGFCGVQENLYLVSAAPECIPYKATNSMWCRIPGLQSMQQTYLCLIFHNILQSVMGLNFTYRYRSFCSECHFTKFV